MPFLEEYHDPMVELNIAKCKSYMPKLPVTSVIKWGLEAQVMLKQ